MGMSFEDHQAQAEDQELDEVLGQTYHLLAGAGDEQAAMLVLDVDHLRLEATRQRFEDGEPFLVTVWSAVLDVEPFLVSRSPLKCASASGPGSSTSCDGTAGNASRA